MSLTDKWASGPNTYTVAFFHKRIAELVDAKLAESGQTWEDAVWNPDLALTKDDFAAVEAELLATGYRYDFSARISLHEDPDKYKAPDEVQGEAELEVDHLGRAVVGSGDNVFRADANVVGIARFINDIDTVMDMLTDGVPDDTVAVIDDSGGTLTAPILEGFTAVICKGGTVRSHLGILTREYRIPCLMAAEVHNLSDGDRVEVEVAIDAHSPYAKADESAQRARVWKLA